MRLGSAAFATSTRSRWERYRIGIVLRWVGTLVLGVVILYRSDLGRIADTLGKASVWLVMVCVGLYAVDRVVAAWKWQLLFNSVGERMSLPRALEIYLKGSFLGALLPATVGVDAVRVHLAARHAGTLSHALGSVVVERFLGIVALLACALAGLVLFGPAAKGWFILPVLALVCLAVGGGVLALRLPSLEARRPRAPILRPLFRFFAELQGWLRLFTGRPRLLLLVFTIALGQLYLLIVITWLLSRSLELPFQLSVFLWLWPLVLIAIRLPISVLGFGVREFLLLEFATANGVSQETSVALGVLSGGLDLLFVGLGGVLLYVQRRKDLVSFRSAVIERDPSDESHGSVNSRSSKPSDRLRS